MKMFSAPRGYLPAGADGVELLLAAVAVALGVLIGEGGGGEEQEQCRGGACTADHRELRYVQSPGVAS